MFKHRLLPVLLFLGLTGCRTEPFNQRMVFQGQTMGTLYTVQIVVQEDIDRTTIQESIQSQLDRVDLLMSNWLETSEVSRFNKSSEGLTISPETTEVIAKALRIANQTGGAFDPTLGPLIKLWGFGPKKRGSFPDQDEVNACLAKIGYQHLRLEGNRLSKDIPEITVNLSAIAKGYGVDLVSEKLKSMGYRDFAVEVGGEVRTSGVNDRGTHWRFAIENPLSETTERQIFCVTSLDNRALATSGDYRNHFVYQGQRFSHIIDPRNGFPIRPGVVSVSVVAPDCCTADALATAAMVMGPKATIELIESLPEVECLILEKDDHDLILTKQSSGMGALILSGSHNQ